MLRSVKPSRAALVRAAFKLVRIPHISKIKSPTTDVVGLLMAEDEGFEPPQTESESGVLPLHKSSIERSYYTHYFRNVKCFPKYFLFPGERRSLEQAAKIRKGLFLTFIPEHDQDIFQLFLGLRVHEIALLAAQIIVQC